MEYSKKEQILHCFEYDSDEYTNIKLELEESNEYTNSFYEYLKVRKELISNIINLEYKNQEQLYCINDNLIKIVNKTINDIKIDIINNQKILQSKISILSKFDDNILIKLLVIENFDNNYEGFHNILHYSSPFMSHNDFMQKMILPKLTNEIKSFLRIEQNFSKYYNKMAYGSGEYKKLAKIDLSNDLIYNIIEKFNKLNTNDKEIIELEKYILNYKTNYKSSKEKELDDYIDSFKYPNLLLK